MTSLTTLKVTSCSSSKTLMLMMVLMLATAGTLAMPGARQPRWLQPCSGETAQAPINMTETGMSNEQREAAASQLARIAEARLRAVSTSVARLKSLLQSLKSKYVEKKRFVDASHADDILRTYPGPHLTNLLSPSSTAVMTDMILSAAFEGLARLSLYIERARIGEVQEIGQHVSFHEDYSLIQNDSEGGLYQVLCNLKAVMIGRDVHLSRTAETAIRQLTVDRNTNTNRHTRHVEDYGVLDVLEKLLTDFSTCLTRMS